MNAVDIYLVIFMGFTFICWDWCLIMRTFMLCKVSWCLMNYIRVHDGWERYEWWIDDELVINLIDMNGLSW